MMAFATAPACFSRCQQACRARRRRNAKAQPRRRRSAVKCVAESEPAQQREIDVRGFQVPRVGEVVTYAGKWPGEDCVGLVEGVQFIESRAVYVVDVLPLKSVGPKLFGRPSARAKGGVGQAKWMDVGEVRLTVDAVYEADRDAYRVERVNDGYKDMSEIDPDVRARYNQEYEDLKQELLRSTAVAGLLGTVITAVITRSLDTPTTFATGALASLVYVALLNRRVDNVGANNPGGSAAGVSSIIEAQRFLLPALPFALVYARHSGRIDWTDAMAATLGFLSYKWPILSRSGKELIDSLADVEPAGNSVVSGLVFKTAKAIKGGAGSSAPAAPAKPKRRPIVLCGPSGVGKSSLIRQLMTDYPKLFGFCVSHTTRAPRPGEEDGVHYHFCSVEAFQELLKQDGLVEWAEVHGNYYGTSFAAVEAVLGGEQARNCLLDIDVQGVQAVYDSKRLDAIYIWIAPPSMEALEERLRGRGTETEESIRKRLQTGISEMEFAAKSSVFDYIVVNDFGPGYAELKQILQPLMG